VSLVLDIIQVLASVATAAGVFIAGWQLSLAKQQATTAFEDQLSGQYRDIARRLPVQALLGEPLDDASHALALPHFYHYFDLSNEQAYLHLRRRVRPQTWAEWKEGIEQNLQRPAFARAWTEVSRRAPESFNELRAEVADRLAAQVRNVVPSAERHSLRQSDQTAAASPKADSGT
jgi:hypothetical protein